MTQGTFYLFNFMNIYGYIILCDLFQSAKTTISKLEDHLKTLKEAEAQQQKVSLNWEICSCVAQGMSII